MCLWKEVSLGEGNGNPLQYSCLENPMDGGAWWAAVHGVAKSWTRLSDFTFTFHLHTLEREMATHSSVLAWRIPGMAEPGGLLSVGLHRVGHDWSDLAAAAAMSLSLVCTLLCLDSLTQYIDCEIYPLFVLWSFIVIAVWYPIVWIWHDMFMFFSWWTSGQCATFGYHR